MLCFLPSGSERRESEDKTRYYTDRADTGAHAHHQLLQVDQPGLDEDWTGQQAGGDQQQGQAQAGAQLTHLQSGEQSVE